MEVEDATMPAMNEKLVELCNDQVTNELGASHLYLSMAAWLEAEGLDGCASWMRAQAEEEREHAMRFYTNLNERGQHVRLDGLEAPQVEFENVREVFETALEHERKVTSQIHTIYAAAEDASDYPLRVFLDWFVEEQVEEEATFEHILELIELLDDDPKGVYELDRRLGDRGEE